MSGTKEQRGQGRKRRTPKPPNTSERLQAYIAKTQTALDIVALLTLWIVVIPLRHLGVGEELTIGGIAIRLLVSVIYGVDLAIRAHLAPRHLEYVRTHPIALFAVIFPPIRLIFSLRLIASLFRRGHITRFLIAAAILLLNGAIIVYYYEYSVPGANITTPWISIWWAIVTVATVGYGDFYPITVAGRIVASFIMAIGILTLAVVTAQVSSSFMEQSRRRRDELDAARVGGVGAEDPTAEDAAAEDPAPDEKGLAAREIAERPELTDPPFDSEHVAHLHARLARIEAHLAEIVRAQDDDRPIRPDDAGKD